MRQRFNLDLANLDRVLFLVHGAYGSGKTHLEGDFLRWAKQRGEIRFLNIKGEDGATSLAHMGLGEFGETVSTVGEYREAIAEYAKLKLVGVAIDSLPAFYNLILIDMFGEIRYPDAKKDGERGRAFWGQATMAVLDAVTRSRDAAPYVMWVSSYDKSENPVDGTKSITPNLPGKLATGIAGSFDMVGYLAAETLGADRVERKVTLAPSGNILTRQRLPRAITGAIKIPAGGGGWAAIFGAMESALKPVEGNNA